jgi:hypothetical protein
MSAERWDHPVDLAELARAESEWDAWYATHMALMSEEKPDTPRELLESSAIHWRRDWDALAAGFVLGVLFTLAVQGAW